MELQRFIHDHSLVFIKSDADKGHCSRCGESLLGPYFSCVHGVCEFKLHKQCAEAPGEMSLSFHPNHNFTLLKWCPVGYEEACRCDFCNKRCDNFFYHCSCGSDLHIKCALFLYDLAKKRMGQLEHIRRIDPLISTENHGKELKEARCFACLQLLLDSEYLSPESGFYLHTMCVDLRLESLLRHDHPLLLQFNKERLACVICERTQESGLVYCCLICKYVLCIVCATTPVEFHHPYHRKHPLRIKFTRELLTCQLCDLEIEKGSVYYCCSSCEFTIHIKCVSLPSPPPPPPAIPHKNHPHGSHPFLLLKRRVPYICDACGTQGNDVSYTCHECNIMVHRRCTALPRAISFYRHFKHPLFHNYFVENDEVEMSDCGYCLELVKTDHGSYSCSICNYIVHVNCALKTTEGYREIDPTKSDETDENVAPYSRVTETSINHFSHHHYLEFGEDIKDEKQCDGCVQFISTSYYYCSQCDFFLHESCAELPLKNKLWFRRDHSLLNLHYDGNFYCYNCEYLSSGFRYIYDGGIEKRSYCLRCACVSDIQKCDGHIKHSLSFLDEFKGVCNACGIATRAAYRCKRCEYTLHSHCLRLPLAVQHNSDQHLLKLTYGDSNDYTESHYCDVCEEKRIPNIWYYSCKICDTAAHEECVIGPYSFIKSGSRYTKTGHPQSHSLTLVRKVHFYPNCSNCHKPCVNCALECKEGCGYFHLHCGSDEMDLREASRATRYVFARQRIDFF